VKAIFALVLGSIAMLLAITAQDSLSTRIILGAMGLALYAVALSPGCMRGKPAAPAP
jgi:hypothetical protein